jgi:hypothetical protein
MTHIPHRGRFAHAALALVLVVSLASPGGAQCRQFLYWSKGPVFADNVPTCFSRVLGAMTQSGFSGIKKNALEVAGSKGGAYASVTCIDTKPRSTAVVMVVGGNEAETIRVRDDLFIKVTKTQGL